MKLKLKEELKGLSISINIFGIGLVTMDTNKINEEDYKSYHKLGFQDSFEEVKEEEIVNEEPIENNIIIKEYKNIVNKNVKRTRSKK